MRSCPPLFFYQNHYFRYNHVVDLQSKFESLRIANPFVILHMFGNFLFPLKRHKASGVFWNILDSDSKPDCCAVIL